MAQSRSPAEGIYRRLTVRMHGDERYMRLSPVLPSGQSLWVYLLTGPHTGPIPGVFVAGRAAMAEALNWSPEAFSKAFAEVLREGLAEFDERTRLCFIPNAIRHNIPANPNVVKSWRAALLQLPECELRGRAFQHLARTLSEVSDAFGKAFRESCGKAFENASPKDSGKQEQKQEQQQEEQPSVVGVADAPTGKRGSRLPDDWSLPNELRDWALSEYPQWTSDKVRLEAEKFRDHFAAKTGSAATKRDWPGTWRNWCRSNLAHLDDARRPAKHGGAQPHAFESVDYTENA